MIAGYDNQDRLLTYGSNSYTYNANGELLTKTTTSYTWDALGNLAGVKLPTGTDITYLYDGQNRRIGKEVNGKLTEGFLYDGQLEPVAELDGSGNIVEQFVYGTRPNVPDYIIKGGVEYRVIADQVGSPVLIVNASTGAIAEQIGYDTWGNITSDTSPGFQPFGFAGGIYDSDTGLVHFGARDYDPQTGRWISKDPTLFNGGEAGLYQYVANDPINNIDPTGEVLCPVNLPGIGNTYLDSSFIPKVDDFLARNAADHIDTDVTSAFRTDAQQAALQHDPNATTPARVGDSLHEAGFAIDISWHILTSGQQATVLQNAKAAGLSWGGNFSNPDPVHFYSEVPGGLRNRSKYIAAAQWAAKNGGSQCGCQRP